MKRDGWTDARRAREMWSGVTVQSVGTPPPALASLRANFSEYALGWGVRDYRGRKLALHSGGLAGMAAGAAETVASYRAKASASQDPLVRTVRGQRVAQQLAQPRDHIDSGFILLAAHQSRDADREPERRHPAADGEHRSI